VGDVVVPVGFDGGEIVKFEFLVVPLILSIPVFNPVILLIFQKLALIAALIDMFQDKGHVIFIKILRVSYVEIIFKDISPCLEVFLMIKCTVLRHITA
jgi:hypothetical protein